MRKAVAYKGPKVPPRRPKRGRPWLADGSRVRLRPERPDHVWSCDFVEDRTHDGRRFRLLNVIDEFTHECRRELFSIHPRRIGMVISLADSTKATTLSTH